MKASESVSVGRTGAEGPLPRPHPPYASVDLVSPVALFGRVDYGHYSKRVTLGGVEPAEPRECLVGKVVFLSGERSSRFPVTRL